MSAPMFSEAWLADYKAKMEARRINLCVDVEQAEAKRAKFGNRKTEQGGEQFDSKKEAARWLQLQALEQAGQITELQRQVAFVLAPAVRFEGEKRQKPALRYIADATYREAGQLRVEDVKSDITRKHPVYRIKRHLMATVHGIDIREI